MRRPSPAARLRPVALVGAFTAAAFTAAAPAAAFAQAAPITFSSYASPVTTEYAATIGRPLTADGFDFFAFRGASRNVLGTWGTDAALDPDGALNLPSNRGPSTGVYATQGGDIVDLYVAGQFFDPVTTFSLFSIDVAHLYAQSYLPFGTTLQPFALTFFGFQVPGADATISQTFTVGVPASGTPVLNRLTFDTRWRGLYSVAWQQSTLGSGATHQFTNVTAAVVPEPATVALVGAGLVALGAGARRAGARGARRARRRRAR